jgi:uncharacterized protein YcbK (DUF882 family)
MSWSDPEFRVTPNFTVREACYLPTWDKMHKPTDEEISNLKRTLNLMEKIRALFDKPIKVHCMIRPEAYNREIGGALKSAHIKGLACDFSIPDLSCDYVRNRLMAYLRLWEFRMEDLPKSNWVHVDLNPPISGKRLFKP